MALYPSSSCILSRVQSQVGHGDPKSDQDEKPIVLTYSLQSPFKATVANMDNKSSFASGLLDESHCRHGPSCRSAG